MAFILPSNEQQQVAANEGAAGSTQHVERVRFVGPRSLRRGSSSSWTAISSPSARPVGRQGTISSVVASPGAMSDTNATDGSNNAFSEAFAASNILNNLPRERETSQASSSTAVASSADVIDARSQDKAETARAVQQADRRHEEIGQLDGVAIMQSNTEAERARYELGRERNPRRGGRNFGLRWQEWASSVMDRASHHLPRRSSPTSNDVEHEAVIALHQLRPHSCQVCKQSASVAKGGLRVVLLSLVLAVASPFLFAGLLRKELVSWNELVEERHHTNTVRVLGALAWMMYWSVVSTVAVIFIAARRPRVALGKSQCYLLWSLLMVLGFGVFVIVYVVVGAVYNLV